MKQTGCAFLLFVIVFAGSAAAGNPVVCNDDVRVEISPVGGKVVSIVDGKSGVEYVVNPSKEESPAGSGALADLIRLTRGSTGSELENSEYRIIGTNRCEAVLRLKTAQLDIVKKITLSGKKLTAAYELTNPGRRPFTGVFRSRSLLKAGVDGSGMLLVPDGVPRADLTQSMMTRGVPFDPKRPKVRNLIVERPVNGNLGWISRDAAVVLHAPFPVLDRLYVFMPDKSVQSSPQPTLEWYSDEFELRPYSELASYAERHPECDRPEDLFVYRFSVSIEILSPQAARQAVRHTVDDRPEDLRFASVVAEVPVFTEWETKAAPVLKGMRKRLKILSVNTMDMSNEMLEFARRTDCEMRIVEVSNPHVMINDGIFNWYSWRVPDPEKAFEKALREKYDVIFMAGILESALPDGIAEKIVSRVKEGTGFVYSSQSPDFPSLIGSGSRFTPTGIPYDKLPFGLDAAVESRFGKGTVVWVKNRIDECGRYWTRGHAMMPVGAHRTGDGGVFGEIVFAYYAKLFLRAAGERCDNDLGRDLADAVSKLSAHIDVSLSRYRHGPGEPVAGRFAAVRGDRAVVTLVDGYGRILARRDMPARPGSTNDFSIVPERRLMQDHACCRVEIFGGGKVVGRGERPVVLSAPGPGKLNFVIWGNCNNRFFERPEVLRRIGFDAVTVTMNSGLGFFPSDEVVEDRLRAGLRVIPIGIHPFRAWKIDSRERKPCLRDASYLRTIHGDVVRAVDRFGKFRPFLWLSGDENSVGFYDSPHDMCLSGRCLSGFRAGMREKYGTIDALNSVWGSAFRSFEDVVPSTFAEAAEGKSAASWYEHRLYMMDALPEAIAEMKRGLVREYPGARLGVSGQLATRINDCFNWKGALRSFEGSVAYFKPTDILPDMIRSRNGARGASSFGGWIGYGADTNSVRWQMVDQIANGMFAPAFWWSPQLIRRGDGRESADGLAIADTIGMLRESACEEMIADCAAVPARVAVIHSLPSFVASAVVPGDGWLGPNAWTDSLRSWAGVIRDAGFGQPDVIDSSELHERNLSGYEAVVLPLFMVMSDREAEALGRYAAGGGKILYDVFCARFDERMAHRSGKPAFLSDARSAILVPNRILAYGAYRPDLKGGRFWRERVGNAFAAVGMKPGYRAHPGFNCRETREGASRYFLVTQGKIDKSGASSIPLPGPMHLYDAVGHRPLGVRKSIDFELPSYGFALFAALPEPATSAKIGFSRGNGEIKCRIRTDSRLPRFFRAKLFLDGVERREYARTMRVVRQGECVFDLGLDGVDAEAVVEVLDVLTGEIRKGECR